MTVLPSFGLSEGSRVTAKDMWDRMVQLIISVVFGCSLPFVFYCKQSPVVWLIRLYRASNWIVSGHTQLFLNFVCIELLSL